MVQKTICNFASTKKHIINRINLHMMLRGLILGKIKNIILITKKIKKMKKNFLKETTTMVVVDSISDADVNYVVIAHCSDADVKIGGIYEEIHEALKTREDHLHICEDVEVNVYRSKIDEHGQCLVEYIPVA